MKRIGLLGGMSWESSIEYERIINETIRAELGGTSSADLIIRSYNFADMERRQAAGDWQGSAEILRDDARLLEEAGAGLIVLCTNTMHRVAGVIESGITVPFLHIADATAARIVGNGLTTVGLLGTRYTMEGDFYSGRLTDDHGLTVIVPSADDRTVVHDVIYEELVRGVVTDASRSAYLRIISSLISQGAQGIIAGCTEIELLVSADDVAVPYFPTARIHAEAAALAALA